MSFNSKYNLEEGQLAQRRVLLLINYDLTKTYGENLTSEQLGFGLPSSLPFSLMGSPVDRAVASHSTNWIMSWDAHDWLTFVDITSGILGMIPSPLSPVLLGISFAASAADGILYLQEGDPYMGGLMLAFSVIPGNEFLRAVPGLEKYSAQGGIEWIKNILVKAKNLSKLKSLDKAGKAVIKTAKEIQNLLGPASAKIAQLTAKYTVSRVIEGVIKLGGKALWGTVRLLSHMGWAIGKPFVQLGGIYYSYDEIYLALYGTDEEKLKLRYNSRFQQLVRLLKIVTNVQSVEEQAAEFLRMNQPNFETNPNLLASIDYTEKKNQEGLEQKNRQEMEELKIMQDAQKLSVPLEMVLRKVINPFNGKPYVIRFGQKGPSVREIQNMLIKIDPQLEPTLKGYKEKGTAADSFFGDNTLDAILLFQGNHGLTQDGVVGAETVRKLIEEADKKNKSTKIEKK